MQMTENDIKEIRENTKRILNLRGEVGVLSSEIKYLNKGIKNIQENHLVHIQTELETLTKIVKGLELNRAEQTPVMKIINKIIEYVILSVVIAGLVVIGLNQI